MPYYQYSFQTPKGKKKTAVIESTTLSEAKEKLRGLGILIFSIRETAAESKKWLFLKKNGKQFRQEQLAVFTTQLAQLVSAKIPLYESLLSLADQNKQENFHPILVSLCEQIKTGSTLSQSMQRFPGSFNPLFRAMVAAGESIGSLDSALERLAAMLTKQIKVKKQIMTALLYPSLLCGFSLFLITILLTFVIPSLKAVFEDQHVNRFTQLVFSCSSFITQRWPFYTPVILALIGSSIWFFKRPQGKAFKHRCSLRLPIVKNLTVQASLARFSRTMGSLLQGGVPVMQSLQIGRSVMNNQILEAIIEEAEHKIVEGSMLSKELGRARLIPSLVTRMLIVGEESGTLPTMLIKIAELYEVEVEKTVARITALAQPIILLGMGGLVGTIMLAVLLPLTDVSAFMN